MAQEVSISVIVSSCAVAVMVTNTHKMLIGGMGSEHLLPGMAQVSCA